jgi:sugar transferase (PEP-CTERM system associated)
MKALRSNLTGRYLGLIAFEGLSIALAVVVVTWLLLGAHAGPLFWAENGLLKAAVIAVVCQTCLYYCDLYDLRNLTNRRGLMATLVQALGSTSLVLAFTYLLFPSLAFDPVVIIASTGVVIGIISTSRATVDWLARRMAPRERILIIGVSDGAIELARELERRRAALGVEIVGFIDSEPGRARTQPGAIELFERGADIAGLVRSRHVDRIVVSLEDSRGKLPMDQLLQIKLSGGVQVNDLPSVYEEFTGKISVEHLRPSWLIFSEGFRKSRRSMFVKRSVDIVVGLIGLVLSAPLMLLTAALVKLSSSGPVLYHQTRVGADGSTFTVHKFRSMVADAEAKTGAVWAHRNDTRITPVGRFLRRSRLDELPQLWNVLRGDMSMVGPRPERPEFVAKLTEQIPFYGQRHLVRPGLTGWAQVRYTYGASVEDAMQKLQYDLFYIKNLSLALDIFILVATLKTVIQRRGA